MATITLPGGYKANVKVMLCPASVTAEALTGAQQVYAPAGTTTTFTIVAGAAGLAASTAYVWNYMIIG